ncbi:MAG: dihydrofolate synthase, partial [Propionibacteriaceae bacterium]|nr:dihydrofolate synthase [Propionibacteriaceae bacterium]
MSDHRSVVAALESRWPEQRVAKGTERIEAVLDLLGRPQDAAPLIHITGTNGKGSTAIIVDALLRAQGLRTGRFSSPHLVDPAERIAIDGAPISPDLFDETWAAIEPCVTLVDNQRLGGVPLTFFEVITAMAYAAFADAPVDALIMEVGMGGTWDATNVADAEVAVVTPIGLDHTHLLGPTVTAIAAEKAGIIKPDAYAVLAGQLPEAAAVLLDRCAAVGAQPVLEGQDFGLLSRQPAVGGQLLRIEGAGGPVGDLHLPLFGAAMAENAAVAVAAVEAFHGLRGLDPAIIEAGFANVVAPARTELVHAGPPIVVDTCHNPPAVAATLATMDEAFAFTPQIAVWAAMADKDSETNLRLLEPAVAHLVATQVASPRALPAAELGALAAEVFGPARVTVAPDVADAIERAVTLADDAGPAAGILVGGSVILAGAARHLLAPDKP